MQRLIFLILTAPFWVHLAIAAGLGYLGYTLLDTQTRRYDAQVELSRSAPPPEVAIHDYQRRAEKGLPEEVNLRVQIATDYNIRLIKKTNGIQTNERMMYVLTSPDAAEGSKEVLGAIILTPTQVDGFADWAMERTVSGGSFGPLGPVLTIPGLIDSPSDSSHATDALKNQGLTKGKGFVYIEPFLKGREAGLAVTPVDRLETAFYHYLPALLFVLSAAWKFLRRNRRQVPSASAGAAPVAPSRYDVPPQPAAAPVQAAAQPAAHPLGAGSGWPSEDSQKAAFQARIAAMMANPKLTAEQSSHMKSEAASFRGGPAIVSPRSLGERIGALLSQGRKVMGILGMMVFLFAGAKLLPDMGMPTLGAGADAGAPAASPVALPVVRNQSPDAGANSGPAQASSGRMAQASPRAASPAGKVAAAPTAVAKRIEAPVAETPSRPGMVVMEPYDPPPAASAPPARVQAAEISRPTGDGQVVAQIKGWFANLPIVPVAAGLPLLLLGLLGVIYRRREGVAPVRPDPFERLLERRRAEMMRDARA